MIPLLLALVADVTLITADGRQIQTRDLSIVDVAGQLTIEYVDASDRKQAIRAADVVEIVFGRLNPRKKFGPEDVMVLSVTGDVFHGAIVGPTDKQDGVKFATGPFGEMSLLFEQMASMKFLNNRAFWPKKDPDAGTSGDTLITKSSNMMKGTINAIARTGIDYYSPRLKKNAVVVLEEMAIVIFAPPPKPPPGVPNTLVAIVSASDGSTLQGTPKELKAGVLTLRDLWGREQKISTAAIASIHFKNGRVVYVSDVPPSKVEENANYIRPEDGGALPSDLVYPWQADKSAAGTKLSIRGKEFRKGIGVRAFSSLTYSLEGKYKKFQAAIGLDDCMDQGDVVFEVWVDGKKLVSRPARAGEPAHEFEVDVTNARELKLIVDFGGHANIGDFADWGSARLTKE